MSGVLESYAAWTSIDGDCARSILLRQALAAFATDLIWIMRIVGSCQSAEAVGGFAERRVSHKRNYRTIFN
jgi:hypothetical protein